MKLSMLSRDERPREKLLDRGASSLSNVDLLAILLRTGTGKMNVLELARNLLAANGNRLEQVARMSAHQLCGISGIGKDKAATLLAAFELVRRIMAQQPERDIAVIGQARDAYLFMEPKLMELDHEECWLIYLSRQQKLLGTERLTSGTMDSTGVDNQMIISRALARKATKLIIVHNHPDGNPTASEEDIISTTILRNALHTVGIRLLDHIIVGKRSYYSFAEEKLIETTGGAYNKKTNNKISQIWEDGF